MMRQYYHAKWSITQMEAHKRESTPSIPLVPHQEPEVSDTVVEVEIETSVEKQDHTDSHTDQTNNETNVEFLIEESRIAHQYRRQAVLTSEIEKQITSGDMLKDDTINFAQKILVEQFNLDRGFEDTKLKYHCFSKVPGKFLQIFQIEDKPHWILAIKGKFEEVDIYDSFQSTEPYPKEIIKSIAKIASCSRPTLKLNIRQSQQQTNDFDSGVFAIANAVEKLSGGSLESVSFDKNFMREHLLTCLQLNEFSPFPKTTKRVRKKGQRSQFFDVYCECRDVYFPNDAEEDEGLFMAMCSVCCEWFHKKCLRIPKKVFTDEKNHKLWKCKDCL